MSEQARTEQELARYRRALAALTVVALAVLVALVVLLIRMWQPKGLDVRATRSGGLRWVRSIYGYGPSRAEQLQSPTDVAVGPDGTVWVTDPGRGRVLGFSRSGALRRIIGSVPATGHARVLVRPEGVGAAADGSVYVADYGRGIVLRFDRSNRVTGEWRVPAPMDVAFHEGRIAVSSLYGVAIIERDGSVKTWGKRGRGAYDFDVAHGIAFGPDGSVFVADTQNGRVKAYAADGTLRWIATGVGSKAATASAVATVAAGSFEIASGMAVDASGRVMFCDPFESVLVVLDGRTGRELAKHGELGARDGELQYPSGIAYDAGQDRVVVADTRNGRVQVFEVPGSAPAPRALARRSMRFAPLLAVLAAFMVFVLWAWRRRHRGASSDMQGAAEDIRNEDSC
ncbi:MAG: NHL repeat-containing protein [Coriobacteriia bacterium]|nr:NHL repeat-containing protein [Coriobacteriia bacterium]